MCKRGRPNREGQIRINPGEDTKDRKGRCGSAWVSPSELENVLKGTGVNGSEGVTKEKTHRTSRSF